MPASAGAIRVMLFQNFLASLMFSIVLPTLWPLLKSLGNASKVTAMGWAVAVNSAGSFISSPLLGYWNDARSTKEVMGFTLAGMFFGNVAYIASAQALPHMSNSASTILLMVARFIVGFAAGNFAVVQAYFSYATAPQDRTRIMSLNSASGVLGFIAGPALAAAFSLVPTTTVTLVAGKLVLPINDMTMPGIFAAVISLVGLAMVPRIDEIDAEEVAEAEAEAEAAGTLPIPADTNIQSLSVASYAALSGLMAAGSGLYVPANSARYRRRKDSLSVIPSAATVANYGKYGLGGEASASPAGASRGSLFGKEDASWTPQSPSAATWSAYPRLGDKGPGLVNGADDSFGDSSVVSKDPTAPLLSDVEAGGAGRRGKAPLGPTLLCLFLYFVFMSSFTTFETLGVVYTSSDPELRWTGTRGNTLNGIFYVVLGVVCVVGLAVLSFLHKIANDRVLMFGCTLIMTLGFYLQLSWDGWVPAAEFFVGAGLSSMGYSLSTALIMSVLSKILEGLDQGFWMGAMSSASSAARLVGPLLCSFLWDFGGTDNGRYAMLYNVVLLATGVVSIGLGYRSLRPRTAEENRNRK